jgi:branched-chain amino acid transport system substrate-binding protein
MKKWLALFTMILMVTLLLSAVANAAPPKDKIRMGWVTSLSGILASSVAATVGPAYEIWLDEVNSRGGIYVKEYGRKLPVEIVRYDDKSDVGTMTKLLEKAILEDKVDFVLAPWGTAMLYAAASVANKHKYILLGNAGGAIKLREIMPRLPYVFSVLNMADTQMPLLAQILSEVNVKKVAMIYIEDLHGIEYRDVALQEMKKRKIEVVMSRSFPHDTKDLTPLLKEAKAANVDAFLGLLYPEEAFLATGQSMEIDFSPRVFFLTVGPMLTQFRDAFSARGVEGIMGGGAWNEKTSPEAKRLAETLMKKYKGIEYWGQLFYYSSMQFLEKAIEEAGTLDQKKIRDVMAVRTFDTAMGPMRFDKLRFNVTHPGEIGQWQNGSWEIIDMGKKRTAAPVCPKPQWPQKQK